MIKGNLGEGNLLNEKGELAQAGWATKLTRVYDRNLIAASKWRIKEWDYYIIGNERYAVALTVADNGYMAMASASWLDFVNVNFKTTSEIAPFTFGKVNMPSSCYEGDVLYNSNKVNINFFKETEKRTLICNYKNFWNNKNLTVNITLTDFPEEELVIATPWNENKKAFYYNNKTNCMKATGFVRLGDDTYDFSPEDSMGTLDWGRGVWTYKNTWYWGSMSTMVDGHKFGFNIGYGFGERSTGTENMLFYDGKAHKLQQITFNIPIKDGKDDFLSPWTFTSSDKRFEMTFSPILDRCDNTDLLIIGSNQHQVFGKFNGKAVLDDGTEIILKDKIGFAEKVMNKW
ncbi:MAG TPA: DUF2804 domain-containing protein [Eubacteriales bacterium]|nr:DUF2804 domain-containing protein [Eubacteriales bacterium]